MSALASLYVLFQHMCCVILWRKTLKKATLFALKDSMFNTIPFFKRIYTFWESVLFWTYLSLPTSLKSIISFIEFLQFYILKQISMYILKWEKLHNRQTKTGTYCTLFFHNSLRKQQRIFTLKPQYSVFGDTASANCSRQCSLHNRCISWGHKGALWSCLRLCRVISSLSVGLIHIITSQIQILYQWH